MAASLARLAAARKRGGCIVHHQAGNDKIVYDKNGCRLVRLPAAGGLAHPGVMPPPDAIPLPKAAKQLGLTPEAVRQRIKRGELEGFRDNRGRWQVVLGKSDQQSLASDLASAGQTPALRTELAIWQERADGLAKRLADRDRELAEVKVERDRLLAIVERLTAERANPERRPWQGLRSWWRRLWSGEE